MILSATCTPGSKERRIALVCWRLMLLILATISIWPVSNGYTRLVVVTFAPLVWFGMWWLFGRHRMVRWLCLLPAIALGIFLILPVRQINKEQLRKSLVVELQKYEGARYVWGGENSFGIDCSGLVRRSYLTARWKQAIGTANGGLFRETLVSWWYDASARALQGENRGETRRMFEAESIRKLDTDRLLPGDFAVTSDGIHVLAYLGDGVWIEADPGIRKVIKLQSTDNSQWLTSPVDIMRWRKLE